MARKKIVRKKAIQKQAAKRKRGSFSREKNLAVVRVHKAGMKIMAG